MLKIQILFTLICWLYLTGNLEASVPLAPRTGPDGKVDMFGCMQSNDYYIVNFAAYQSSSKNNDPKTLLTPWCQTLPQIGDTTLAVDLLDRDVRRKPVSLRLIDSKQQVIFESPSVIAKQGVITAKVNFPQQGLYDVMILIQDDDLKVDPNISALHIPLTVATSIPGPPATSLQWFWVFLSIFVIALVIGMIPRMLQKKADSDQLNETL